MKEIPSWAFTHKSNVANTPWSTWMSADQLTANAEVLFSCHPSGASQAFYDIVIMTDNADGTGKDGYQAALIHTTATGKKMIAAESDHCKTVTVALENLLHVTAAALRTYQPMHAIENPARTSSGIIDEKIIRRNKGKSWF